MIVFIDQNVPEHNDAQREGSGIEYKTYYDKLRKFFKDKDVVVALHPSNKPIDSLNCIKGETEELIKKADLVYAHDSSAIKFAVKYNKPIKFLTFNGLGWFSYRINEVAKKHNKTPINIDEVRDAV